MTSPGHPSERGGFVAEIDDGASHLQALRADFDLHAGRSLALPSAGAVVWAVVGVASLLLPAAAANLLLG